MKLEIKTISLTSFHINVPRNISASCGSVKYWSNKLIIVRR
jgi:hypothetical protein